MFARTARHWCDNRKLGPALRERLTAARECDSVSAYIAVAGNPARDTLRASSSGTNLPLRAATIRAIKAQCVELQRALMHTLSDPPPVHLNNAQSAEHHAVKRDAYWINNIIHAEVAVAALPGLLQRADVDHVELAHVSATYASRNNTQTVQINLSTKRSDTGTSVGFTGSNDPTWSVQRVGAPFLWQRQLTGEGVVVAILDSGVNYQHPDLTAQMWDGGTAFPLHGYNFERDDHDPTDISGHGTSCAGIVAGNGMSGRTTGVAPHASLMAVRIDNRETACWKGMQFALEHGAHVINQSMSWMPTQRPYHPGWRRACETVLAAGVLHTTSAGNKGDWQDLYGVPHNIGVPANCPPPWLNPAQSVTGGISSAIACGATTGDDLLDDDSSVGPSAWQGDRLFHDYPYDESASPGLIKPDLCAPGPTETCNWKYGRSHDANAYTSFGKTSSATAHLSGSMALLAQACLRSAQPIRPACLLEALKNSAVRIRGIESNPAQYQQHPAENGFGAGRIDVYAAYQYGMRKGWWV